MPAGAPSAIDFLRQSHAAAATVIENSASACGESLGALFQLDLDIRTWETRLASRPEARQLTDARRELAFATYASTCGLYVPAYAGLRLFLELSFASVYFSVNELHRRRWIGDRADFSWTQALAEQDGVLAANFIREFSESAAEDAAPYARDAALCYRRCSQFVHGKFAVTEQLPDTLQYDVAVLEDWLSTAGRAAKSVLYLLYARYGAELLPGDDGPLIATLESTFGHLKAVRRKLGLPVEQE